MATSYEQRNPYLGDPPRPWIVVRLEDKRDQTEELRVVADTGNPFELIIDPDAFRRLTHGEGMKIETNFGFMVGGWIKIVMPDFGLKLKVEAYASDVVVDSVK